jgi:hypothetical protein
MPSRLITDSTEHIVLNGNCTTDAVGGLTRGLAEVLAQIELKPSSGRAKVKFSQVLNGFAEPEVFSAFPSACVYALEAEYDENYAMNVVPSSMLEETATNGEQLYITNELSCRVNVEIWCQDTKERSLFVNAIEQLSSPVEYMSGMRIQLPHYYNTTCTLSLKSVEYEDTEELNSRRYRKARFTFMGSMCVFRTHTLPKLNPKTKVTVTDIENDGL